MSVARPDAQPTLVGIPEIAEIANVGRSAVGNWRKRHTDFPTANVQTPSGALFDLREVEEWLIEHGKIAQRVSASARLWALAATARGVWRPEEVVTFSISCLVYFEACARASDESASQSAYPRPSIPSPAAWSAVRDSTPAEFLSKLSNAGESIETNNPELRGLLVPGFAEPHPSQTALAWQIALALDEATDAFTPRFALFEEALANLMAADRFAQEFATPDDVSHLMSRLVDVSGGTLFDPAVGEGGLLLMAAIGEARDHDQVIEVVGIDVNEQTCRLARSRFYLYDVKADIRCDNALTADLDQLPRADAVLLDPPYGLKRWGHADLYMDERWKFGPPPPGSADLAWLQLAVGQLSPEGRAGVLLPFGSLFRGGPEAEIRKAMITSGVVEAIVVLPPRLRTDTSIPLAVWLMRSPEANEKTDAILLVDASGLGDPGRARYSLAEESIDRLVGLVRNWRERRTIVEESRDIAIAVTSVQIIESNLDPKRYRQQPEIDVAELRSRAEELRGALRRSSIEANEAVTGLMSYLGKS